MVKDSLSIEYSHKWEGNDLFMTNSLKESLSKKVQNNTTGTSGNRERGFLSKKKVIIGL